MADAQALEVLGDEPVASSVQSFLQKQVISAGQDREQDSRDRSHSTRGDQRSVTPFEVCKLTMQDHVIRGVIQPNVTNILIRLLAPVLECRRLEDRHIDRTFDARLQFP